MTRSFNLPPGCLPSDIPDNDPDECSTCGGFGSIDQVEKAPPYDVTQITCPTCSGLGVVNERTKYAD